MASVAGTFQNKNAYTTNPAFWYQWEFQAIFVYLMVKVLYKKIRVLIPLTYIPILKLSVSEPETVEFQYKDILENQNETVNFTDSPREKWRKLYGNMTREFEWVLLELYKVFSEEQANELFVSTMTLPVGAWIGWLNTLLEKTFIYKKRELTALE